MATQKLTKFRSNEVKSVQAVSKQSKRAARHAAKQAAKRAKQAKATGKAAVQTTKLTAKAAAVVTKAAEALISGIVAAGDAGILVIILIIICIIASIAASPFGIFISSEVSDAGTVPLSQIIAEYKLTQETENKEITTFYSGGMGNFDKLCESVVRELKQVYPLKLYLIVPYMTQKINRDGKYYKELYDDIIVPDLGEVHYKRAITERNKWIAEQSDIILCYIYRSSGGAYQMYQYTQKLCKTIRKLE